MPRTRTRTIKIRRWRRYDWKTYRRQIAWGAVTGCVACLGCLSLLGADALPGSISGAVAALTIFAAAGPGGAPC
jgi:hypothetical protein